MKNSIRLIAAISCLFFWQILSAQDDHGHSHPHDAGGSESRGAAQATQFVAYAESQQYELTLKHGEIEPGKPAALTLYVADFSTNRPLEGIEIKATAQEDPSLALSVDAHEPGVYHIDGTFPKAQAYSLAFNLNSKDNGADLLLVRSVEVGKALPGEEEAGAHEAEHSHFVWWQWALVFLCGLGLGFVLFRRKPRAAAALLAALAIPVAVEQAGAHGPEGHGEGGGTAGTSVQVPKETQFLFDLLTQKVVAGDFKPSVALYGTVAPAPGGFANVVTPQNGRIASLKVTPGQRVSAGQVVAVLKPSGSQSEQVGVAAETGRFRVEIQAAQAELAAAEKEWSRLKGIADVAANKDVQAAEARYNIAKASLETLQNVANGSVSAAANGDIVLKAPVAGTVGQFTLAPGTEVPAGTTLFSITSLGKVYVEAQVYDKDSEVVRGAERYTVTCTNDDHKTAQVRLVSAALEVNPTNQSQKVLFELQNPDGEFKIGEFVTLQAFQRMSNKTAFVPNSALSEINGKPVVFLKDAPETYSVSYVSLGEDNGTHTVVLKGIETGERFVTAGTYQVKMMMLNQ